MLTIILRQLFFVLCVSGCLSLGFLGAHFFGYVCWAMFFVRLLFFGCYVLFCMCGVYVWLFFCSAVFGFVLFVVWLCIFCLRRVLYWGWFLWYCMERYVSEPYSPYDYVRQRVPYPAYDSWDLLTDAERSAVYSYQDLGLERHVWDVEAPDDVHRTCSIINSYLRFAEFVDCMSRADVCQCEELVSLLDSAVSKSVLPEGLNVIRGLADSRWISGLSEDDVYLEPAYGSYSLSVDAALRYARVNDEGKMVFLARSLEKGERALYLGNKEEEMLVERGCKYLIDEISPVEIGVLSPDYEAIVYMLRRI